MASIRSKNTQPELLVRRILHQSGFRFRLHSKKLSGSPDIVLPKYRTVIFVHGCFWHGHFRCKRAALPRQNREFWAHKIAENQKRDILATDKLLRDGWNVVTIWACELTGRHDEFGLLLSRRIKGISTL